MQKRQLGKSDLHLSLIGMGTWAIGGGGWSFGWGPQDDKESIRALHAAYDAGINWVDTAAVYGLGHAEAVVGRALKEMKEKPYIATKCGLVWDEKRKVKRNLTKQSILEEAEKSLQRLKIDCIDLYQMHWPVDSREEIAEGWEAMTQLEKQGKIRYGGVSNFSVSQMEICLEKGIPLTSLQPPYSLLVRDIEKEILPFCRKNNIGVIAYSPLQKGLLTGKWSRKRVEQLPMDDHRRNKDPLFHPPRFDAIMNYVSELQETFAERGKSIIHAAAGWVMAQKGVTAAIVGLRNEKQVHDIVPAGNELLTSEEMEIINEITRRHQAIYDN